MNRQSELPVKAKPDVLTTRREDEPTVDTEVPLHDDEPP
uniref:Uncharacterized protein n=1 Tax=Ciona intestinalis TaxID=7719 RepID=H2XUM9_CIOIN